MLSWSLIVASFLSGVLTILAPCVLPLLPVIIGGSAGSNDKRRPFVITISLALSIVVFTLLLKASTLFISVPNSFWAYVSSTIILVFGISMLWPELWNKLMIATGLESRSQQAFTSASGSGGLKSMILLGAALGPVFSSCSPTYFLILATVLPVSFVSGTIYLLVYALGLAVLLGAIAYFGQRLVVKLKWAANPNGWFRRGLGLLLVVVGIMIMTGFDKVIETKILDAGFGITDFEERFIEDITVE